MPSTALEAPFSDALRRWVERHERDLVAGLSRLIQFPTVSGAETAEGKAVFTRATREGLHWLARRSDRWGLRTRNRHDEALVIEAGEPHETIAVGLHLDVVPPGEGWRHGDPFSGAVEDGQIWGRGAQDNKGPLMAMFHALAAVVATGRPFRRRVKLVIGTQEEIGQWGDVEDIIAREGEPIFSIVPDAVFPLVTGEKGWLNVTLTARWLAPEKPPPVHVERLVSGERPNIVPDLAEAALRMGDGAPQRGQVEEALARFLAQNRDAKVEVHWLEGEHCRVVAHGVSAHGSTPQEGHNALLDLLALLCEAFGDSLGTAQHRALRQLQDDSSDHLASGWGIASDDDFFGPTTVSLGTMRLEGDGFTACLNWRPTRGLTTAETFERIQRRLARWEKPDGLSLTAEILGRPFDPLVIDTDGLRELVAALESAFEFVTGRPATHHACSGSTYAKVFPRAVGFGPWMKEQEPGLFHMVDERIPVAAHVRNVRLYAEALGRLAL
jgi:succinyl-diaminopimelate desuccinylase